jgi:hypothetical protein
MEGMILRTNMQKYINFNENMAGSHTEIFLWSQVCRYVPIFSSFVYVHSKPKQIHWNLGSRTPLFTNNSVNEQIFLAKTSRITNTQAGNSGWRQAESIGAGVSVAG